MARTIAIFLLVSIISLLVTWLTKGASTSSIETGQSDKVMPTVELTSTQTLAQDSFLKSNDAKMSMLYRPIFGSKKEEWIWDAKDPTNAPDGCIVTYEDYHCPIGGDGYCDIETHEIDRKTFFEKKKAEDWADFMAYFKSRQIAPDAKAYTEYTGQKSHLISTAESQNMYRGMITTVKARLEAGSYVCSWVYTNGGTCNSVMFLESKTQKAPCGPTKEQYSMIDWPHADTVPPQCQLNDRMSCFCALPKPNPAFTVKGQEMEECLIDQKPQTKLPAEDGKSAISFCLSLISLTILMVFL